MEFMIRDRLSWMRFLGFDLGTPTPDENTIRLFRNKLTETGTLQRVMKAFDWQLQPLFFVENAFPKALPGKTSLCLRLTNDFFIRVFARPYCIVKNFGIKTCRNNLT